MMEEKVYIVVPVYNVEAYLERCVESILNQTYDNYELVLVDDGSPDHCPAICDRYAAKYDHITVIHQENGGLSAARNAGIEYALRQNGQEHSWITFIDSDDFVHPRYLEYLYRAAKEAGVDISICGYIRTSTPEKEPLKQLPLEYITMSPEAFWKKDRTNATIAWGKLYRMRCFAEVRYPVGKIHEDEFTTYKVLFQCPEIVFIKEPLYYYYVNSSSITHTQWAPKRLQQLDALEEQVLFFSEKGYRIAYTESMRHLLQHCIKHLMYINTLSPQYDHLKKEVRKRRNSAFQNYAAEVGMKKAYEYWYEVRIKSPMQRVLKNESVFSFLKRRLKKMLKRI